MVGLKTTLRNFAHQLGVTNEARFRALIKNDRKKYPDEYVLADEVLGVFHDQGGVKQYIPAYKLVSLGRLLNRFKPNSILELGTGSSSIIFAKYANDNWAEITHVDEGEKWLQNTQVNIINELSEKYTHSSFVLATSDVNLELSPEEFCYRHDIDRVYDLVFVDGPALLKDEQEYKQAICTDISKLLPGDYLPKVIVIDMRSPTVSHFEKVFADYYECDKPDVLCRNPRPGFGYFSVSTLIDGH